MSWKHSSTMSQSPTCLDEKVIHAKDRVIRWDSGPLLVGILNVTPDSFFDGGRFLDPGAATAHAVEMVKSGADLLDIGGESSRPGAIPIDESEELRRVIPVVQSVCRAVSVPIAVDTTRASVARRALEAGAVMINDISALRGDPDMARVVADAEAGIVLMHMQGTPQTMQEAPAYVDVMEDVKRFFAERIDFALQAGIALRQIMLDPGFGFGKLLDHNLTLLAQLKQLTTFGRPILVGVSRKAFIGRVTDRPVQERLFGTAAAVALAVERGAALIRVHDVPAMRDVVNVVAAVQRSSKR
ncbi:MAG: dihydropteroate synthase [Nitrospiraceae bacterium]